MSGSRWLPQPTDVIRVHLAGTEFEARTIVRVLEAAGVPSMIRSRVVPGYQVPAPAGTWGEILVRPGDADGARAIIAEFLASAPATPVDEPDAGAPQP